jgi:hypothetical protein
MGAERGHDVHTSHLNLEFPPGTLDKYYHCPGAGSPLQNCQLLVFFVDVEE